MQFTLFCHSDGPCNYGLPPPNARADMNAPSTLLTPVSPPSILVFALQAPRSWCLASEFVTKATGSEGRWLP